MAASTASTSVSSRRFPERRRRKPVTRRAVPYLLLLPTTVLLVGFFAAPFVSMFYFALRRSSISGHSIFVGLANFRALATEARFLHNIATTLQYLGGVLVVSIPLAYLAAVLVCRQGRGTGAVRTLLLLPWAMAPVATALLFRTLMDPSNGPVSQVVGWLTGNETYLMLQPGGAIAVAILHSAWRSFPLGMLIIAAGMTSIPAELYEAARIDGGGLWTEFWHVTLPMTRPQLLSATIVTSVFTVHDVEGVLGLTQGGPGYATEVVAIRLFREAFSYYHTGIGSAIGIVLVALTIVVLGIQLALSRYGRRVA